MINVPIQNKKGQVLGYAILFDTPKSEFEIVPQWYECEDQLDEYYLDHLVMREDS